MSPDADEAQYLKPGEAAKLLGVSAKTIDRWALQGRIPCVVTLGGHRRFRLEHVLAVGEEMAATARDAVRSEEPTKAPVETPPTPPKRSAGGRQATSRRGRRD